MMTELTLEKFEEAAEIVKKVTVPTNLVYSDFLVNNVETRFILNLKICRLQGHIR